MKEKLIKRCYERYSFYLLLSLSAFLFFSCTGNHGIESIKTQKLFSLKYGNFDKQLNLFDLSNSGQITTYLNMKDGFFYIANGEAKKIMELNSYGDLLTLYYNKNVTAKPDFASSPDVANCTRRAVEYPFNSPRLISVDSKKNLYVADILPQERQERDKDRDLLLSQVVLRFSSDGKFIDYLGQQGPGGTPFPFIQNIYTLDNDEFVVICLTNTGRIVYWFSSTGYLLFTIPIDSNSVPNPFAKKNTNDMYISVDGVIPDYLVHKLYLKVDYYTGTIDEASKVQSGIDYTGTMLYTLDVENGTYLNPLSIPSYQDTETDGFSKLTYNIPYDFLGATDSGWFFFMITTDTGFTIQMVQMNGQKILKRNIAVDNDKVLYYTFSLSDKGILSGLFARKDAAEVDWWRTDKLLEELVKY